MTSKQQLQALQAACIEADNAWQATLEAAFGRDAGDRRYDLDKSSHPAECQAAHAVWKAIQAALKRARDGDQLTDADLTNLRTACFTSTTRRDPQWRDGLDALADKLDAMREPATEPTPEGLQYVVPGCEKDRRRGPEQMELF